MSIESKYEEWKLMLIFWNYFFNERIIIFLKFGEFIMLGSLTTTSGMIETRFDGERVQEMSG